MAKLGIDWSESSVLVELISSAAAQSACLSSFLEGAEIEERADESHGLVSDAQSNYTQAMGIDRDVTARKGCSWVAPGCRSA
jgi:hypothetical protein